MGLVALKTAVQSPMMDPTLMNVPHMYTSLLYSSDQSCFSNELGLRFRWVAPMYATPTHTEQHYCQAL